MAVCFLSFLHIHCGRWLVKELRWVAATMRVIIPHIKGEQLTWDIHPFSLEPRQSAVFWLNSQEEKLAVLMHATIPLQTILRLFYRAVLEITWLSPSPPPPPVRVSRPRRAACEPNAPRLGCGAPVPTTVSSSQRRSRSSRSRAGSGARSQAPVPASWWGGGPAALWQWRWWHWCVTP